MKVRTFFVIARFFPRRGTKNETAGQESGDEVDDERYSFYERSEMSRELKL